MKSFRRLAGLAVVVAVSVRTLACLDDFTVLPPDGGGAVDSGGTDGSSPQNDSSTPGDGGTDAADASDGRVPTFCDTYVPTIGIADHFCADFDTIPIDAGFQTTYKDDAAVLAQTTDLFVSPPASLNTFTVGNTKQGFFEWKHAGATAFKEARLEVSINPAQLGGVVAQYPGTVCMAEITTNNALVEYCYANGANIQPQATYSGYFLRTSAFGGAAALAEYKIPTALIPNQWTRVTLIWAASGPFELQYNGVSVLTQTIFASTDTVVKVQIGALGSGDVEGYPAHRLDNLIVEVKR